MYAPTDNTSPQRFEQAADPAYPPASNLIGKWAQVRRQMTPWAYLHLRGLAVMRAAIGIFLVGVGAMLLSLGYWFAAIPLAGAALHFSLASLDFGVVRSAARAPQSAPTTPA